MRHREPAEPTPDTMRDPVRRYFMATRPAFLGVSLCAAAIGLGTAAIDGSARSLSAAVATVAFALIAHAGTNVLNDYYDARNGCDAANVERVFPYTGGSRFIQNGVISVRQTLVLGLLLFALVGVGGVWLTRQAGIGLLGYGVAGLLLGWAYSAPPMRLSGRGLGEPAAALGMALIAAGADFVQRRAFSLHPWLNAAPFALLALNILLVNEFPDQRADRESGKRQWVVRLGAQAAGKVYAAVAALAQICLLLEVWLGVLPVGALLGLLAAPWSILAARELRHHGGHPQALARAIEATIHAAMLMGGLLALGLLLAWQDWL